MSNPNLPYTVPDLSNPNRGYCSVEGCFYLQRNHGNKRWGKYCEKHHEDPIFKKERLAARRAVKEKKLQNLKVAKTQRRQAKSARKFLARACKECEGVKPAKSFKGRNICKQCVSKESRERRLQGVYGIDNAWYIAAYTAQNGCCAICGEWVAVLNIDHCHSNDIIRGLLCNTCNFGLGYFKDNLDLLASASSYLINSRMKSA